jgi:hypothetical protein
MAWVCGLGPYGSRLDITVDSCEHNNEPSDPVKGFFICSLTERILVSRELFSFENIQPYNSSHHICERHGWVVNTPLHSREVLSSNIGPKTGYPDWCFRGFSQSLHASVVLVPQNYETIASLQILTNSLLTYNHFIRRNIVSVTERVS